MNANDKPDAESAFSQRTLCENCLCFFAFGFFCEERGVLFQVIPGHPGHIFEEGFLE